MTGKATSRWAATARGGRFCLVGELWQGLTTKRNQITDDAAPSRLPAARLHLKKLLPIREREVTPRCGRPAAAFALRPFIPDALSFLKQHKQMKDKTRDGGRSERTGTSAPRWNVAPGRAKGERGLEKTAGY